MDLKHIEDLAKLMEAHGLHQLVLKQDDVEVKLVSGKNVAASAEPVATLVSVPTVDAVKEVPEVSPHREVRSPFVGTFYRSSSPGAEPFVQPGKVVQKGDTLCIVEAMKLMNEIEAECSGTVVDVLVENEQPVEYNQVLFRIKP